MPSPVPLFPGFTNRQAALLTGAATFRIFQTVPFYHFVGGTFDPSGLLYTDPALFFTLETAA